MVHDTLKEALQECEHEPTTPGDPAVEDSLESVGKENGDVMVSESPEPPVKRVKTRHCPRHARVGWLFQRSDRIFNSSILFMTLRPGRLSKCLVSCPLVDACKFWLVLGRRSPVLISPWITSVGTWKTSRGLSLCG